MPEVGGKKWGTVRGEGKEPSIILDLKGTLTKLATPSPNKYRGKDKAT